MTTTTPISTDNFQILCQIMASIIPDIFKFNLTKAEALILVNKEFRRRTRNNRVKITKSQMERAYTEETQTFWPSIIMRNAVQQFFENGNNVENRQVDELVSDIREGAGLPGLVRSVVEDYVRCNPSIWTIDTNDRIVSTIQIPSMPEESFARSENVLSETDTLSVTQRDLDIALGNITTRLSNTIAALETRVNTLTTELDNLRSTVAARLVETKTPTTPSFIGDEYNGQSFSRN